MSDLQCPARIHLARHGEAEYETPAAVVATLPVLAFTPGRATYVDNVASVLLEHDADGRRLG